MALPNYLQVKPGGECLAAKVDAPMTKVESGAYAIAIAAVHVSGSACRITGSRPCTKRAV